MPHTDSTLDGDDEIVAGGDGGAPVSGLVLLFSAGRPRYATLPLAAGRLELGRGAVAGVTIDDRSVSRHHAAVGFDGRAWTARDLGSRNGTALDGEPLAGERRADGARLLRIGDTLLLLAADLR